MLNVLHMATSGVIPIRWYSSINEKEIPLLTVWRYFTEEESIP